MKIRFKSVYLMEWFSVFVFNVIVMVDYYCVIMSIYVYVLVLILEFMVFSLCYLLWSIIELWYLDIFC